MERELGERAVVSIGTAKAVEVLLDESYEGYKTIHINLRTLVRNFLESFPDPYMFKKEELASEMFLELERLMNLLDQFTVKLYIMDSFTLPKTFPLASVKNPSTTKQIMEFDYETSITQMMVKRDVPLLTFKHVIKAEKTNSIVLTSFVLDLFSYINFNELVLLESYTGKLVGRANWFSKIHKDEKWKHCPFDLLFLQVLGDRSNQFKNKGLKWSKHLLELSVKYRWKPQTTKDKMVADIKKMPDKFLADQLISMVRVKIQ